MTFNGAIPKSEQGFAGPGGFFLNGKGTRVEEFLLLTYHNGNIGRGYCGVVITLGRRLTRTESNKLVPTGADSARFQTPERPDFGRLESLLAEFTVDRRRMKGKRTVSAFYQLAARALQSLRWVRPMGRVVSSAP